MNSNDSLSERYRGHLSLCEIDLPGQKAISSGRVLIIGAGGLGSPVAMYLAAAGVGTIGIVDADTVSLSNLQRQIMHGTADLGRPKVLSARDTLLAINDHIDIRLYREYLTADNAATIMTQYDIVVDCTDSFTSRLLINDQCIALGLPLVFGSVSRFSGQVFTHLPGTADYRTIYGDTAPEYVSQCSVDGILNTVVGIVGTIQATEVIKYLAHTGDLLTNRLLHLDALTMTFTTLPIAL